MGVSALGKNTTASANSAVGYGALYSNTTGADNTAMGYGALQQNTTASNNSAFGEYALKENTTGQYNSAFGRDALRLNTTASNNTAVGYQAGYTNTTGVNDTFIGWSAGYSNTTGDENTFVGNYAGYSVTTGSKNTILGRYNGNQGGLDIRTASNYIVLSDGDGNPRGIFDGSGNFLVGRTSVIGTEKFNVTSASTEVAFFQNSSNTSGYSGIRSQIGSSNTSTWHFRGETRGYTNYYLYGNGTTSYSSDIRLKKNVQTARGYLEDLNKLRVVKYQWKGEDPDCQQVELGLIAQEVEEVFPNLIQEHEVEGVGNMKHIKQSVLPFMMLKAIQEQQAIIESLTARVSALEGN
jgi:trimeric autotransporter adhesin